MKLDLKEILFLEILQCHLLNLGRRAGSLYIGEVLVLVGNCATWGESEAEIFWKGMESTFALDLQIQALPSSRSEV